MPDLAFAYQSLTVPATSSIVYVRIDAMLVEEIDPIRLETPQRGVRDLADVRRPAVQPHRFAVFELESELRGDHDVIAHRPSASPTSSSLA